METMLSKFRAKLLCLVSRFRDSEVEVFSVVGNEQCSQERAAQLLIASRCSEVRHVGLPPARSVVSMSIASLRVIKRLPRLSPGDRGEVRSAGFADARQRVFPGRYVS